MHPESVPVMMVARVPGIAALFDEQHRFWQESTGRDMDSDQFFTSVVVPHVAKLLRMRRSDIQERELSDLFQVIEVLSGDENSSVRALVDVSFLEELLADRESFDLALNYMGPNTRAGALTMRKNLLGS